MISAILRAMSVTLVSYRHRPNNRQTVVAVGKVHYSQNWSGDRVPEETTLEGLPHGGPMIWLGSRVAYGCKTQWLIVVATPWGRPMSNIGRFSAFMMMKFKIIWTSNGCIIDTDTLYMKKSVQICRRLKNNQYFQTLQNRPLSSSHYIKYQGYIKRHLISKGYCSHLRLKAHICYNRPPKGTSLRKRLYRLL